MAAITLRSVKGSALTNAEVDANFTNLNTELGTKVTLAQARAGLSVTGAATYDSATGVLNVTGGVTSVNGYTGTVSLTKSDLGLGNVENKSSATIRSELTSSNVTTALGFTPYNATNPSGYISGITSSMVTTALGFTPYNSTNPSGYLTDAMRNRGSVAQASVDTATLDGFYLQSNPSDSDGLLVFTPGGSLGTFQFHAKYTGLLRFRNKTDNTTWTSWKTVLHDGNYNSYAPTLTGTGASGTWGINITGSASALAGYTADLQTTTAGGDYLIVRNQSSTKLMLATAASVASIVQGGASGTWGISVSGNAATVSSITSSQVTTALGYTPMSNATSYLPLAGGTLSGSLSVPSLTNSAWYYFADPQRDADHADYKPNASTRSFRFAFVTATSVGTGGNYAGLLHFAPWTGTTASTGDASYQLAFGSTAANGSGDPRLRLRKGIDTTWNSWVDVLTSVNYTSYSPGYVGSGGAIRIQTAYGYVDVGPMNTGYSHFQTDRDKFYFNKDVYVDGQIYKYGDGAYLHSGNYRAFSGILRSSDYAGSNNVNWNTLGNNGNTIYQINAETFNTNGGTGNSNYPTSAAYAYGTLISFNSAPADGSQAQIYISHQGNDLIFRGGWYLNGWQAWNRALTNLNYSSYALPLSGGTLTGAVTYTTLTSSSSVDYGIVGNNGYFDTLNSGVDNDSLELVYHRGTQVKIGSGTYGSKPLYASALYQGGRRVADAALHSSRDFVSGTIISTDIDYSVADGDAWVLEITGNSYGSAIPWDIQYQGYIYSSTIINHGGISNGTNITGMVALNVGGKLTFWFPRQAYWQGFEVRAYSAYANYPYNRVTSITDGAKPSGTKEVDLSSYIRQSLHSGNYSSYALPLSGGTMTGALTISGVQNALMVQNDGNSAAWYGRILSKNATGNVSSFLGNYNSKAGVFAHTNALDGWSPLYVNTLGNNGQGTVYLPAGASFTIDSNNATFPILTSANYTSYTPINLASGTITDVSAAWTAPGTSIDNGFRVYRYDSSATNKPVAADNANWLVNIYSHPSGGTASYGRQIAGGNTDDIYTRNVSNGSLGAWRTLLHSGNYQTYVRNYFGSPSTSGTLDWNHSSNTQPGAYGTLLLGTATNGMGGSAYYHPLNFEYTTKDGTGNVTQMAVAYSSPGNELYMRGRYEGTWGSWVRFLNSNNYSSYALPLSGGTVTGPISLTSSGYIDNYGHYYSRANYYVLNSAGTGWLDVIVRNGGAPYINNVTYAGSAILHAGNYTSYALPASGSSTSGLWMFNNMGVTHSTYQDFNNVPGFGAYYVQQGYNSPTGTTSHQWYGFTLGLGSDYAYSQYASQLYWPRRAMNGSTYLYIRDRESGTWSSWTKIKAGSADDATTVTASSSFGSMSAVRGSYYGYSSSYGAIVYGATSGNVTPCFNVDPIANTSGNFNGTGIEVMFRNGFSIITPNAANNNYHNYVTFTGGVSNFVSLQQGGNQVLHAGNWTAYVTGLPSKYSYQASTYISDSTTAATLSAGDNNLTTVAMHSSHGSFGGYATTLTMTGYNQYGAYQISGSYNATTPELAVRNFTQSTSNWTSWVRLLSSANYTSYSPSLATAIWGDNGSGSTAAAATQNVYERAQYKSGFWDVNGAAWAPSTAWYWGATFAHTSNNSSYNYSGQLAFANSGGGDNLYARTISAGSPSSWSRLLSSGNYHYYALPLSGGLMTAGIGRADHSVGHLVGSYNSVGANSTYSNPIYTIGSSYNPTNSSLSNMYGVGYSHSNFYGTNGSATGWGFYVASGGTIAAIIGTDGAWFRYNVTAYSDERLKTDWSPLADDFVARLAEVKNGSYTRIDGGDRQVGVSAQSLRNAMPEAVIEGTDGMLSVAHGNAALASAVELAKEVVRLRAEIEAIKALIRSIK